MRTTRGAAWRRPNYSQIAIAFFEIDTLRNAHETWWNPQRTHIRLFFFSFFLSSTLLARVDRQPLVLNSGDAKCRWNDCTRRDAFHFAWISNSRQCESSQLLDRKLLSATNAFESHRNFFPNLLFHVFVMWIAFRLVDDCIIYVVLSRILFRLSRAIEVHFFALIATHYYSRYK